MVYNRHRSGYTDRIPVGDPIREFCGCARRSAAEERFVDEVHRALACRTVPLLLNMLIVVDPHLTTIGPNEFVRGTKTNRSALRTLPRTRFRVSGAPLSSPHPTAHSQNGHYKPYRPQGSRAPFRLARAARKPVKTSETASRFCRSRRHKFDRRIKFCEARKRSVLLAVREE